MDIWAVVAVCFLLFAALAAAINHKGTAEGIGRYYNSIPEGRWGPKWLRWQFRPTPKQADILAWLTIPLAVGIAAIFLIVEVT